MISTYHPWTERRLCKSGLGISTGAINFRHIYHSPSLEKLYGRSAQEFYDNPTLFKEITHPEDQHLTEKAIGQLLEEGQATRECLTVLV
jgi:hypothetical protein